MHLPQDSIQFVRLPGTRGAAVDFTFDGQNTRAYEGETVAAALGADGRRILRTTARREEPRGAYCMIGVCFDCLVEVDGRANVRACQQMVGDGMTVRSQAESGPAGGSP